MLTFGFSLKAQEHVAPVNYNPFVKTAKKELKPLQRTTAASLPFFDDFTTYSALPDKNNWMENEVYINNTMGVAPITRGVATFDALNANGVPYDSLNRNAVGYADSLTSVPIDLSGHTPGDSLYLSFFYQPAGMGFAPDAGDSLELYMLQRNGEWRQVWSVDGDTSVPFAQVMIPVTDTEFFYSQFQFRFVNIASININDDIWNLDYVRFDANRNINDTAVNDVAFSENPGFMLNDLTYMPYRHFLVNPNSFRANTQNVYVRNNYSTPKSLVFSLDANETTTGAHLSSSSNNPLAIGNYTDLQTSVNVYTNTIASPGTYNKVIFENKFALSGTAATEPKANDTIIQQQIFDNYLAYDDGTAEKSYFLNLFSTLPGKIAIEYNLAQPDTIWGISIYFGRQVPMGTNKFFSAIVYASITPNSPAESVVYEEDLLQPSYDSVNHFWNYRFTTPVLMPAGQFYIGTLQPALSGSDSLYIGLDLNRVGGNHAYYNVLDNWVSSSVSGALMIRPILGENFTPTAVADVHTPKATVVYPNPANDVIYLSQLNSTKPFNFEIADIQGRIVLKGQTSNDKPIGISNFSPGVYTVRSMQNDQWTQPEKIVKL
ncbi:hypothetical protein DN068_20635 [Taibaiella soli]|uniref:Secretion system C-terminal sorting domain-containing protein n=1 Tax=Taibaiella soli TaxID=1649169 RepID=A0A2W2B4T8_9BACT|nr:hypothetical protein DN068_20635 [Taibaiella soli]